MSMAPKQASAPQTRQGAVPINLAAARNYDPKKTGKMPEDMAWSGMRGEDAEAGVRVTRLEDEGAAKAAGLQDGDIVLGVGDKIRMLADGQCEFHTSMGMEMDCTRFTLGFRNQRFSMLIEDGVVTELNVEEPGGYDVSDASVIVEQLKKRAGA